MVARPTSDTGRLQGIACQAHLEACNPGGDSRRDACRRRCPLRAGVRDGAGQLDRSGGHLP
jgi:hypothetical protein